MADAPPSRQSERAPERPSGYHGNGFNPIVGDRVAVGAPPGSLGWVRFLGTTSFSTGEWFGIELDEPAGKNDGSVKGERYFECKDKHGLFVRRPHIRKPEVKGEGRSSLVKAYDALEAQPKEGAVSPSSPTSPETEAASPAGIAAPKARLLDARLSLTKSKAPGAPRRESLNGVPPAKATPTAPSPAAKPAAEKKESVSILKKGGALAVGRQEEERRRSSVGRPKSAAPPSEEQRRATPTSTKEESAEEVGREIRSLPSAVDRHDPEINRQPSKRYSSPIRNRNSASPKPNAQAILRANSREHQVLELRRELAEAMEDHDIHRLRGLLPAAESAGVEVNELEHARRIIDTSMQQEVMKEIELVREAVSDLASLVQMVEGRASQLPVHVGRTFTNSTVGDDDSVKSQASEAHTPAVIFDEAIIKAFLDELGERIQTELRGTITRQLEEVVTKQVRQHVAQATQEVSQLAKEVRDLTSAAALKRKSSDLPIPVPSDDMKGAMTLMTEEEAGIQKETLEDPKSRMSVWNASAKMEDMPAVMEDMPAVHPDTSSDQKGAAATKIQASFRGYSVRKVPTKDMVGDKSETQAEAPAPTPGTDQGSVVITCKSCNNTGMDFFGSKCPCPYGSGAQAEAPAPTAEAPAPTPAPDTGSELKSPDGNVTGDDAEVAAATKIQATYRGSKVRKDLLGSKSENEAEGNEKSEDKENETSESKEIKTSEGKENEKPEDKENQKSESKENDKPKDKALAPPGPDQAAVQIQAAIRGKNDRRILKRREAAARTIQRVWRGEYTRRVVKDRVDSHRFAAAVVKAARRHANWLEIFEDLATEQSSGKGTTVGLEFQSFREALKQVHPQISGAQAEVLFQGYTQGVGSTCVDLTGFIDIAEAVTRGNREAGEFAEISGDAFAELADLETVGCSFDKLLPGAAAAKASNEEGEEAKAATAIQAKWRGNQVRKKTTQLKDQAEQPKDMDEDEAEKPKEMDEEAAATKIQAGWKGKQVRKQMTKDNNSEEPKAPTDPVKVPTSMDAEYYRVHFATCPPTLWSSLHQHFPSAGGSQVSQDANAPTGSPEEDAAAARIQANWKGKQVRRELEEQEKVVKEQSRRATLALWKNSSTRNLELTLPNTDDSTSPDKALLKQGDDNDEDGEFEAFCKLPSVATWYIGLPVDLKSPGGALASPAGALASPAGELASLAGAQATGSKEIQDVKRSDPEAQAQWNLQPSVGSWLSARRGASNAPSPAVPHPEEGISPLPVEGSVPCVPMILLNPRSPCDHSPGMDDFLRFI